MAAKILIVDDAQTVRMYLRAMLEEAGHEVLEARDGSEGWELAVSESPSLAFVDINMPVLDGYGLVRKLREDETTLAMPVIMCSTESKPIDEQQAYEAGANFYLRKPVNKDLVTRIARILGAEK